MNQAPTRKTLENGAIENGPGPIFRLQQTLALHYKEMGAGPLLSGCRILKSS